MTDRIKETMQYRGFDIEECSDFGYTTWIIWDKGNMIWEAVSYEAAKSWIDNRLYDEKD